MKSVKLTYSYAPVISQNTILIIEPNPYHGVILPGLVNIVKRAGYKVHVMVRGETFADNPFVRMKPTEVELVMHGNQHLIKNKLKEFFVSKYSLIIVATNVYWEENVNQTSYIKYLSYIPESIHETIFIERNLLCLEQDDAVELLGRGRVFTLLEYTYKAKKTNYLNTSCFGVVKIKKRRNKITNIILIGSSSFDKTNLDNLYAAVRKLVNLHNNIFKITIIGHRINVPHALKRFVTTVEHVSFAQLYDLVEEHDYLLTIVNHNSEELYQKKYTNGTTSGTVLLSLGFAKPMILSESLAKAYDFTNINAVVYKEDDLYKGLKNAVSMSQTSYYGKVSLLHLKAKKLQRKSVINLSRYIKKHQTNEITHEENEKILSKIQNN